MGDTPDTDTNPPAADKSITDGWVFPAALIGVFAAGVAVMWSQAKSGVAQFIGPVLSIGAVITGVRYLRDKQRESKKSATEQTKNELYELGSEKGSADKQIAVFEKSPSLMKDKELVALTFAQNLAPESDNLKVITYLLNKHPEYATLKIPTQDYIDNETKRLFYMPNDFAVAAANVGNIEILKKLHQIDDNRFRKKVQSMGGIMGGTILHEAARSGQYEVIGYLLENDRNLASITDNSGNNALHTTMYNFKDWDEKTILSATKGLLELAPQMVIEKNDSGFTPTEVLQHQNPTHRSKLRQQILELLSEAEEKVKQQQAEQTQNQIDISAQSQTHQQALKEFAGLVQHAPQGAANVVPLAAEFVGGGKIHG